MLFFVSFVVFVVKSIVAFLPILISILNDFSAYIRSPIDFGGLPMRFVRCDSIE